MCHCYAYCLAALARYSHILGMNGYPSPLNMMLLLLLLLSRFSRVRLCVTPWTAAHQAPVSKGFSRQEWWSGMPFPSPNMMLPIYYLQIAFIRFKKFHLFYILQRLVSMWALFAFIDMIVHIFLT